MQDVYMPFPAPWGDALVGTKHPLVLRLCCACTSCSGSLEELELQASPGGCSEIIQLI